MKTLHKLTKHGALLKTKSIFAVVTPLFMGIAGCKKFVELAPPVTQITSATAYADNTSAAAVVTGIYDQMISTGGGFTDGTSSIGYLCGAQSDELTDYASTSAQVKLSQFYINALSSSTGGSTNYYFWPELYKYIYSANAVLAGLNGSSGVTASMKQQLIGEAKFMRAFCDFYAVNLYGDVPLVTTTNYLANNTISRSPKALVYQQIIQDLKDAQSDLSVNFVDATGLTTTERTRPNKGAATALLARTYLYTAKYDSAAMEATKVISDANYSLDADLTQVFLANSNEAIWQLQPTSTPTYNTFDAYYFILTSTPGTGHTYVALSPELQAAFEPGDLRLADWVGTYQSGGKTYYFPYKYKVGRNQPLTEYLMVLRLSEQYLIRAEAEVNGTGGVNLAIADLNVIRNRAGLPNYNGAATSTAVLAAILHERQVELFTEWGHRWFDLIRTGNVNAVMGSPGNVCQAKGGNWNPNWALLPLPLLDMQIDPKLTQNPGY